MIKWKRKIFVQLQYAYCIYTLTGQLQREQKMLVTEFGLNIQIKTNKELSNPCGVLCSNFEAEAKAIITALKETKETFHTNKEKCSNLVIFTDSLSVLQALENQKISNNTIEKLKIDIHGIISTFSVKITLQWIPSHCDLPGNEAADRLAKRGANKEQPNIPISQNTCKQIIKENLKTEWLNNWAQSKTGRSVYSHLKEPNPKDPINTLERREQVVIYRLRTQHIQLNAHLNRIRSDHSASIHMKQLHISCLNAKT